MKRTIFVLLLPFLLSSCAQLFDSNLYAALDQPPPLNKGDLANKSVGDLKNLMDADDTFLEQLQNDPDALAAVQTNLINAMNDPDATVQEALDAAATLMAVTEGGSEVATLKDNAINNQQTIGSALSGGHYTLALKIFMGEKSEAEIKSALDNLVIMGNTAEFMMTMAASPIAPKTINSDVFFSGTDNKLDMSLSCLMAAIGHAQVADSGGSAALAAIITSYVDDSDYSDEVSGGTDMTAVVDAIDFSPPEDIETDDPTFISGTYSYAYVATLKSELPPGISL